MNFTSPIPSLSSRSILKESSIIASAVFMLAVLSRISIPLYPVPVTGQTLGVLIIGMMLGPKRALTVILAYLSVGILGLPVFANGAMGPATLMGPSGGYLLGFIPAACIMGYLGDRGCFHKAGSAILPLILGHSIIFVFGLLWLARFTGWQAVLSVGLVPFLPGAVIKTALALAFLPALRIKS